MHEAFWNGLFDTRWEDAPLGREAIRLVLWLRERGYRERSRRDYAHAVVHLGRVLHEAQAEVTAEALDEAVVAGETKPYVIYESDESPTVNIEQQPRPTGSDGA